METTETKSKRKTLKTAKENGTVPGKRKSKIALWWEKNPNGTGDTIVNMRAVLK